MRRTELLQEIRKMRFEEAYGGWHSRRLTQSEAARLLGVCDRTFRRRVRYVSRYDTMVWTGFLTSVCTGVPSSSARGRGFGVG